jgi:hypothetical protein
MDNDNDPLDSGIHLDVSDGCEGVAFLILIGMGVIIAALVIMVLQAAGVELLK